MPHPVVALDANVLVPILACDFLLTAFDLGLYEPVVSTIVLDEVERALLDDHPHLAPTAVADRVAAMRDVLADHVIDTDGADVPIGINAKDRHVVSAALLREATTLATNDTALRNEVRTAVPVLTPLSLDEFGNHLCQLSPGDVSGVIDSLVAKQGITRIYFHILRHTRTTHLVEASVAVKVASERHRPRQPRLHPQRAPTHPSRHAGRSRSGVRRPPRASGQPRYIMSRFPIQTIALDRRTRTAAVDQSPTPRCGLSRKRLRRWRVLRRCAVGRDRSPRAGHRARRARRWRPARWGG